MHLIGVEPGKGEGLHGYLGERDGEAGRHTGALDHIAFFANDLAEHRAALTSPGLAPRERTVPALGLHQLFVVDPDGIVVELSYAAQEAAA